MYMVYEMHMVYALRNVVRSLLLSYFCLQCFLIDDGLKKVKTYILTIEKSFYNVVELVYSFFWQNIIVN